MSKRHPPPSYCGRCDTHFETQRSLTAEDLSLILRELLRDVVREELARIEACKPSSDNP